MCVLIFLESLGDITYVIFHSTEAVLRAPVPAVAPAPDPNIEKRGKTESSYPSKASTTEIPESNSTSAILATGAAEARRSTLITEAVEG